MLMDRAYEDDATRGLAFYHGHPPVVPPKRNRLRPWKYDEILYAKRNCVERFFRRIKGFRRICTRYDKSDVMFMAYIQLGVLLIGLN